MVMDASCKHNKFRWFVPVINLLREGTNCSIDYIDIVAVYKDKIKWLMLFLLLDKSRKRLFYCGLFLVIYSCRDNYK